MDKEKQMRYMAVEMVGAGKAADFDCSVRVEVGREKEGIINIMAERGYGVVPRASLARYFCDLNRLDFKKAARVIFFGKSGGLNV